MKMKAISIAKIQEFDRLAIEEYGIPSIVLMENAGLRTADFIKEHFHNSSRRKDIIIVSGCGKNGGDGFVAARHLLNCGFSVTVFILGKRGNIAGDSLTNLRILERMRSQICFTKTELPNVSFKQKINNCALIVDAIFGTGLKREISDPIKSYINYLNSSKKPIVALDIPSGLNGDTGKVCGIAVKAKYTVTFAFAKKGFFLNQGPKYAGRIYVADISIPKEVLSRKGEGG